MSTATKTRQSKSKSQPAKQAKAQPVAKPKASKPKAQPVEQPEQPTSNTSRKHELMDYVASGKATIGTVLDQFGMKAFGGMRTIARQVRFGRYQVAGLKPDTQPANDPEADKNLAERLSKMKPNTRIVQLIAPPRRK